MSIIVTQPSEIKPSHLKQIIKLIKTGGEIKISSDNLKKYLRRADLIAYELKQNKVICTATLKNPFNSYKAKVFTSAKSKEKFNFEKELGYIATQADFEGKGHCSKLLKQFFEQISANSIYATTKHIAKAI